MKKQTDGQTHNQKIQTVNELRNKFISQQNEREFLTRKTKTKRKRIKNGIYRRNNDEIMI